MSAPQPEAPQPDFIAVQMSFGRTLFDRIDFEARKRGTTFQAEARRTLTYAYDFEDAVSAHGRGAHPSYRGRLTTDPPDLTTDENGVPL